MHTVVSHRREGKSSPSHGCIDTVRGSYCMIADKARVNVAQGVKERTEQIAKSTTDLEHSCRYQVKRAQQTKGLGHASSYEMGSKW